MLLKKVQDIIEDHGIEYQSGKVDLSHSYRSPNTTGGCN